MKLLDLKTEFGEGPDTDVNALFDGQGRKLMQITLRNGAVLKAHKASEPITVQCIAGRGIFLLVETQQEFSLTPGTLLTLEPDVVHEVRAADAVSILLSKFKNV